MQKSPGGAKLRSVYAESFLESRSCGAPKRTKQAVERCGGELSGDLTKKSM